jgi:hypothetical protein
VSVPIHDRCLPLLPAEAVILSKLYVLQKDRCDWPDLLNVLSCRAADLDWRFLIEDMHRDDLRLLGGLLNVFAWMDPAAAGRVPGWVWDRVGISAPEPGDAPTP